MDAIVMAAGEGRRLRPLTERWPKPVLPIDGRPVLATLLRELAAAGIGRAIVVVGHLAEDVERLAGDGSGFDLAVRYARQPEPLGSADAVSRALAAGAGPPVVVTAADTVYTTGDIRRFVEAWRSSGAVGALAVRRDPPPTPGHRAAVEIGAGLVQRVVADAPGIRLGSAPLWMLGPELVPFLDRLGGPPFELGEAVQRAIDSGLAIAGLEIGKTRDLTYPVDLVVENFPYLSR
jgi:CTP:molybdopterin cytidylyltransferase MocA